MFSASAACSAQNSQTIARDRRRMNVHKHSRRPFSPAGCCRFPRPVVCSAPLAPTTTFVLVRAPQIKDRCARDSSKMYQADCFFLLFFSLSLSPQSLSNPTPRALLLFARVTSRLRCIFKSLSLRTESRGSRDSSSYTEVLIPYLKFIFVHLMTF